MLDLGDIQSGALHPRPTPYAGAYLLLRVDDARGGRELLRRLIPVVSPATQAPARSDQGWLSVVLSYQGLAALGVPQDSLDSFPEPFRQGMAARADILGDRGESAPQNWESPLGSSDVHIGISALAPDQAGLDLVLSCSMCGGCRRGGRPCWT